MKYKQVRRRSVAWLYPPLFPGVRSVEKAEVNITQAEAEYLQV